MSRAEEFEASAKRYEKTRRTAFRTNDPSDLRAFDDARKSLIDCAVDGGAIIARALRRDEEIEHPTEITQSLGYEAAPVLAALRESIR